MARIFQHFLLRGTGPTSSHRRLLPLGPTLRAKPTPRALFPGAEAGLGERRGRAGSGIFRRAAGAGGVPGQGTRAESQEAALRLGF